MELGGLDIVRELQKEENDGIIRELQREETVGKFQLRRISSKFGNSKSKDGNNKNKENVVDKAHSQSSTNETVSLFSFASGLSAKGYNSSSAFASYTSFGIITFMSSPRSISTVKQSRCLVMNSRNQASSYGNRSNRGGVRFFPILTCEFG